MNPLLKISIVFIFFCLPIASFAEQKIAVVNLERALKDSAYAKAQLERLQNDEAFKANLETYKKLGADFKKMQEDAKVNSVTWSEKQKLEFNKSLQEKVKEINTIGQQLEQQKMVAERDVQKVMMPFLQQALKSIIDEQQLDLLLKADALHFYKPSFDLTEELVSRLDKLQAEK